MDYFKIARALFILIVFFAAFGVVWYFFVRILQAGTTRFIKWLLSHKTVANLFERIRQKIRMWYGKYEKRFVSLWDFLSQIYIDPLFYGYALYSLVTRIQSLGDYAKTHPQYSLWQLLDLDTRNDMSFYIVFTIIFILWMAWKSWKYGEEVRYKKALLNKLESIEKAQKTLPNKIRKKIRKGKMK